MWVNEGMETKKNDHRIRRPWTLATVALTAGHNGFELSSGVGLVGQPELGLAGSGLLWSVALPGWAALSTREGRGVDRALAVFSGLAGGGALVHYLLWPWRRGRLGVPVLTEAEGLSQSSLPAYNAVLQVWGAMAVMSALRDIRGRDRGWAVVGLALTPLLRKSARHHFTWVTDQLQDQPPLVEPGPAQSATK